MAELKEIPTIVPLVPKRYPPTKDQFKRELELRFNRLQMGLNDLRLLIDEYVDQF
jgi:hypothetical protein